MYSDGNSGNKVTCLDICSLPYYLPLMYIFHFSLFPTPLTVIVSEFLKCALYITSSYSKSTSDCS